jgi:hypothetical protein
MLQQLWLFERLFIIFFKGFGPLSYGGGVTFVTLFPFLSTSLYVIASARFCDNISFSAWDSPLALRITILENTERPISPSAIHQNP